MNEQRTDGQVLGETSEPRELTGREAENALAAANAPRYFHDAAGVEPAHDLAALEDGETVYHEVPASEELPAHLELGSVQGGAFVVDGAELEPQDETEPPHAPPADQPVDESKPGK